MSDWNFNGNQTPPFVPLSSLNPSPTYLADPNFLRRMTEEMERNGAFNTNERPYIPLRPDVSDGSRPQAAADIAPLRMLFPLLRHNPNSVRGTVPSSTIRPPQNTTSQGNTIPIGGYPFRAVRRNGPVLDVEPIPMIAHESHTGPIRHKPTSSRKIGHPFRRATQNRPVVNFNRTIASGSYDGPTHFNNEPNILESSSNDNHRRAMQPTPPIVIPDNESGGYIDEELHFHGPITMQQVLGNGSSQNEPRTSNSTLMQPISSVLSPQSVSTYTYEVPSSRNQAPMRQVSGFLSPQRELNQATRNYEMSHEPTQLQQNPGALVPHSAPTYNYEPCSGIPTPMHPISNVQSSQSVPTLVACHFECYNNNNNNKMEEQMNMNPMEGELGFMEQSFIPMESQMGNNATGIPHYNNDFGGLSSVAAADLGTSSNANGERWNDEEDAAGTTESFIDDDFFKGLEFPWNFF
ncbi:PREDICTED: uncharacterized protein LOC104809732 [Tarenaya hassleriana]|uniref:uncharacterized protein LOC104809732 n=1 Tax=Tarenaya hassleriana TaxID=28532 RepID=UPI00053C628E|nr:PREDICTED: uncharacterized protein LOC104809732 [Tarenaya hassleriana]